MFSKGFLLRVIKSRDCVLENKSQVLTALKRKPLENTIGKVDQSVEKAVVAFVKGASERNRFFEKLTTSNV